MIADLLRFANDLRHLNTMDILVKYPDFSIDVAGIDPFKLSEMHVHFANETIAAFKDLGNDILRQKYGFLFE